ncbi:MAG: hypothetical protein OEW12_10560 [Deltaproteobacteria bacterium]|nr:hypothetical protein [Deltaproteobacteria bacterium]
MVLLLGVSGCVSVNRYQTMNADEIPSRNVLFLEKSSSSSLPEELSEKIVSRMEQQVAASGLFEKVVTRQEFKTAQAGNQIVQDGHTYADLLGTMAVSDPDIAFRLGEAAGAGLLFQTEAVLLNCISCKRQYRVGLIGQVVQADTGQVVWRVHISDNLDGADDPDMEPLALELAEMLIQQMETTLAPKWHRVRFNRLKNSQTPG